MAAMINRSATALSVACKIVADPVTSTYAGLGTALKIELDDFIDKQKERCAAELGIVFKNEEAPATLNHYFLETFNTMRYKRVADRVSAASAAIPSAGTSVKYLPEASALAIIKDIMKAGNDVNDAQEVKDVVDLLHAYWKTAAKRFVDNVAVQIVESYFGSDSVVDKFVGLMEARFEEGDDGKEALKRLLSMDAAHLAKRKRLEEKLQRLEEAEKLLKAQGF